MAYQTIIVDDEVAISSGFAKFFPWERLGFEVAGQFSGAEEALRFVQGNPVDVVISDVIMPGMTGIDLAREIASIERASRPLIVLFSAHEEFRYVQQALEYGCSNYILKSAGYNDLIAAFSGLKEKLDIERGVPRNPAKSEDRIITAIKNYVSAEPATANLEEASSLVFLSTSYMSRYFKQKTGINFTDYVMEKRMAMAAELLLDLRYKIYDISNLAGYSNPVNFTRSFKRFYRTTPREYRFEKLGRVRSDDEEGAE